MIQHIANLLFIVFLIGATGFLLLSRTPDKPGGDYTTDEQPDGPTATPEEKA